MKHYELKTIFKSLSGRTIHYFYFNAVLKVSITLYKVLYANPHLSPSIVTQTATTAKATTRKLLVPNNRINFTPKQEQEEEE